MIDIAAIEPHLPTILAVAVAIGFLALLAAVATLVAIASKRRGARTIHVTTDKTQIRKDRLLFLAAFIAGGVVYGALILGSFEGLTTWAHNTLGWHGWNKYLVPVSLDGFGTAAGLLAFRAVKAKTSPYLCYAMVWGATAASAAINFKQGGTHGGTAAFYMAFLSVAVMAMFHLFLEQFQSGAEYVGAKYPRFGVRWITYLGPTVLDALCWVNHPPVKGTEPTVVNAVEHRKAHRQRKAEAAHVAALAAAQRKAELAATGAEAEAATRAATGAEAAPEMGPAIGPEAAPETRAATTATANRNPVTGSDRKPVAGSAETAKRVADAQKRWPKKTQKEIAEHLKLSEKTVRNYWIKPSNVTPIHHKEAAQ